MELYNKILILTLLCVAMIFLSLPSAEAFGGLNITHLDVSYNMVSYEGFIEIENICEVNGDFILIVLVDTKIVVNKAVEWPGHKYRVRKGIEIDVTAWDKTYFNVIETEGPHLITAAVFKSNRLEAVAQTSYYVEEAEEVQKEEILDWLECP